MALSYAALLVVAPQLFGGTFGWSMTAIAVGVVLCAAAAAWTARREHRPTGLPPLAWAGVGLVAWTALQATPAPRAAVELLHPGLVSLVDDASAVLELRAPTLVALSYSPQTTWIEVMKHGALATSLLIALWLVARRHRGLVLLGVAASTLAMGVTALLHLAVDATSVWGLYAPKQASPVLLAPLMNRNHLSGFVAMGVPLTIALGLEELRPRRRMAWFAAAVLLGLVALLAASRGGVASLVGGVLVLAVLGLFRRRGGTGRLPALGLIGLTLGLIATAGTYFAAERVRRDFAGGDLSKLELAGEGLGLALGQPWTGVGRGAFSAAFVAEHGHSFRFTHPENFLVQWASEWGLPVAVTLVVVLSVGWVRAAREARSWSRIGGLAAVASIAAHEMVDFSTELLGVGVVVAALVGACLSPRRPRRAQGLRSPRFDAMAMSVGAATMAIVAVFGWRVEAVGPAGFQAELEAHMTAGRRDAFAVVLRRAVRAHPAEPAFYLLGGSEAAAHDDPRALRWLNQSMLRASGWASPHVETARFLIGRGRYAQASAELRQAEERSPGAAVELGCRMLEARPETSGALIDAARTDAVGVSWLDRVADCLALTAPAAVRLDAELMTHDTAGPHVRSAERALLEEDPVAALRALEPIERISGSLPEHVRERVAMLRARAYLEGGDPTRASEVVEEAARDAENPRALLHVLARARAEAGDAEGARRALGRLRGLAAGRARPVAEVWVLQGDLERRLGNDGLAMQAFERANRLAPASRGLQRVADLSEALGDHRRAYHAYTELCRAERGAGACDRAQRARRAMGESQPSLSQPTPAP